VCWFMPIAHRGSMTGHRYQSLSTFGRAMVPSGYTCSDDELRGRAGKSRETHSIVFALRAALSPRSSASVDDHSNADRETWLVMWLDGTA
jgi:hypothetical protein